MDRFNKFLQDKLENAVLPHPPFIASYQLVDKDELEFFQSQKWPLFKIEWSGVNKEITLPAKSKAAIANLEKSIYRTHSTLTQKTDKKHRKTKIDFEFKTELSYGPGVLTCNCYFKIVGEQLPTVALITSALLQRGLLTRAKIIEFEQQIYTLPQFNMLTSESDTYEKIQASSRNIPSINSLLYYISTSTFQLLNSLTSYRIIEITGIKIDPKLIKEYLDKKTRCVW